MHAFGVCLVLHPQWLGSLVNVYITLVCARPLSLAHHQCQHTLLHPAHPCNTGQGELIRPLSYMRLIMQHFMHQRNWLAATVLGAGKAYKNTIARCPKLCTLKQSACHTTGVQCGSDCRAMPDSR